jgi:beta-N-acetylhexosaminidase
MIGPLMIDVQGISLNQEDKEILAHPLVGGIILFTRNYHSPKQLAALTKEIKSASKSDILIAVDHEGGRVQRFRESFSAIPAMASLWQQAEQNIDKTRKLARHYGQLMAKEVLNVGIDISFAPVLDVNGISEVIGDRAFHEQPELVAQIADAFIEGMHQAGMKCTGKHFPGHGSVQEDSHIALPIDKRAQADIFNFDMLPFKQLIAQQKLDAMMPAHIIFPEVDKHAVGFSRIWLQTILRDQLKFDGVIFSDDLTMQGAAYIGGYVERAEAAQDAGCDMLLVCNNREASIEIIDRASIKTNKRCSSRLEKLLFQPGNLS